MSSQGSGGNVIAALCNVPFPGLGQLVQGRLMGAAFFFLSTSVAYGIASVTLGLFLIVALPLHLWSIVNAARYKG